MLYCVKGFIFVTMKKYLFFILCLLFLNQKISGQTNLVPNPSFEIYTTCPNLPGEIYYATPWFQPNEIGGSVTIGSSSDFYHQCASFGFTSVPSNNYTGGFQFPRTGGGYAGIMLYSGSVSTGSREYIQSPLTSALIQQKTYCIEFYVSLIDTAVFAISNIGAFFSNDSLLYNDILYSPILVTPQVLNDTNNIISDKNNWVLISGQFIANGGERYITIGNFKTDTQTNWQNVGGGLLLSYYYFDDVSVVCCDCDTTVTTNISIPNIFTPNNDNTNDNFKITSSGIVTLNCKIYDRWGILVGELKDINDVWDGRTTSGLECSDGVYYYVLTAKGIDNKEYNQKGFIQLIK